MKKLITILLIGFLLLLKINPDSTLRVLNVEVITTKLILQYADECYKDSTLVDVYHDPNYHSRGFSTVMAGYWSEEWEHKTPTFEGFIEWIGKLDKEN